MDRVFFQPTYDAIFTKHNDNGVGLLTFLEEGT